MVSFTFDDVPKSAATVGAPMLEEYNGGNILRRRRTDGPEGPALGRISPDEIVDLHRRGHEVACHTFSHSRAIDLDWHEMSEEMEKIAAIFWRSIRRLS